MEYVDYAGGPDELTQMLERVPRGWTKVHYQGRAYGLSRVDLVDGRSVTIYAEELGGKDVISANVYRTRRGHNLHACEMPSQVVTDFLRDWTH